MWQKARVVCLTTTRVKHSKWAAMTVTAMIASAVLSQWGHWALLGRKLGGEERWERGGGVLLHGLLLCSSQVCHTVYVILSSLSTIGREAVCWMYCMIYCSQWLEANTRRKRIAAKTVQKWVQNLHA